MHEAMAATSLVECRQLLYHESLRHVPTAATHGRGNGNKAPPVGDRGSSSQTPWDPTVLTDGSHEWRPHTPWDPTMPRGPHTVAALSSAVLCSHRQLCTLLTDGSRMHSALLD